MMIYDDENSPLLGASNPYYYTGIMKAGNLVYDGPFLLYLYRL